MSPLISPINDSSLAVTDRPPLPSTSHAHVQNNSYKYSFLPCQLCPSAGSHHTYLLIPPTSPSNSWHQISTNRSLEYSFSNYGRSLLNILVVTVFDSDRVSEFKKWLYTLFLKHEIDQWSSRPSRKHYISTDLISLLPHPQFLHNQSAFTFTSTFLNTPGCCLRLPFIPPLTYNIWSHLWPLKPAIVNLSSLTISFPFPESLTLNFLRAATLYL